MEGQRIDQAHAKREKRLGFLVNQVDSRGRTRGTDTR
jgi:hypothetical protein